MKKEIQRNKQILKPDFLKFVMPEEILIEVFKPEDFRKWLAKNHAKEKKAGLIIHKKHTGKDSTSHKALMHEAICFGWIDTTIRRLDDDRYIRFFARRSKNSTWSYNTLSYAKQLIKEKRMTPEGLKFYKAGLKKKPHDYGLSANPDMPAELEAELNKKKNKKLKEKFEKIAPSTKRMYYRWVLRAKLPTTKKKRIDAILGILRSGGKLFGKDI